MSAQENVPVFNGDGLVVGRINHLGELVPEPKPFLGKFPAGYEGRHPRWKEANQAALTAAGFSDSRLIDNFRIVAAPGTPTLEEIGQHEPGAKLDGNKPDLSLLVDFGDALYEVARVGTYGQAKYTRGGWMKVPNGIVRYTAALLRHLFAREKYDTDPWYDAAEGSPFKNKVRHDAQVAWNALARLQLALNQERGE